MLFFIITATIAVVLLFYYFMVKPFSYWKTKGVKQGHPKWIVGDNWETLTRKQSSAEMVEMVYSQCKNVRYCGMYQFFLRTLVLKDPDLIKQITVKDFEYFTDHRPVVPADDDPLWGKNLFALTGQNWRDMRCILSPSFTSSKMKSIFLLISECSQNFIEHFLKKDEDIVTIEFRDVFTRFTNDVIANIVFGIRVDSLGHPNNQFYLMTKEAADFSNLGKILELLAYFIFPWLSKLWRVKLFSSEVRRFFSEIVSGTIKAREEKGIVRQDVINLLLEARRGIQKNKENDIIDTEFATPQEIDIGKPKLPKEITDVDIAAQALNFILAGFDSVARLICFMAYELAANPDIQDRLRNEIRSTLEECEDKLTYENLLDMKYLDMVVSETLRKWPVFLAVDRICTKPYTIEPVTPDEKPVYLEKGDLLWLPIFGIHRDPQYYPDPERFDPERFSDENKGNVKPYTYFPFGLGPRNCIGSRFALLETKMVLFHILNNFELVPVGKSKIPLQISKKQFSLSSEGGFWFGLKRIKS